jgi:U3 small nucleolar RNA-associated protein 12
MWHETGHRAEVTCIMRSPRPDVFAVGYADGSIRLWSASSATATTVLNGHKKAVTALAFDTSGTRLASGSQDTDLIVWDVVAEAGMFRYVLRCRRARTFSDTHLSVSEATVTKSLPSSSSPSNPRDLPHLLRLLQDSF